MAFKARHVRRGIKTQDCGDKKGCGITKRIGGRGMSMGNGRNELCDYEHEMSILAQLDDAEKTIEAQRQEITGWQQRYEEMDTGHSKLFKDFCKMKQENAQLKIALNGKEFANGNLFKLNQQLIQENKQLQAQMIQAARGSACIADLAVENVKQYAEIQQLKTTNDEFIRQIHKNIDTIEQLKLEAYNDGLYNDRVSRLVKANEQLQEQNRAYMEVLAKTKEELENIAEYWNGDSNGIAMMDACTNNRKTAQEAIAAIDKAGGGQDG
jgi:hypothetical protein